MKYIEELIVNDYNYRVMQIRQPNLKFKLSDGNITDNMLGTRGVFGVASKMAVIYDRMEYEIAKDIKITYKRGLELPLADFSNGFPVLFLEKVRNGVVFCSNSFCYNYVEFFEIVCRVIFECNENFYMPVWEEDALYCMMTNGKVVCFYKKGLKSDVAKYLMFKLNRKI